VNVRPPKAEARGRLLALVLAGMLPSCATILGIEAGTLEATDGGPLQDAQQADGRTGDAAVDGRHADGSRADAQDARAEARDALADSHVNPGVIYVATSGSDVPQCGTQASPCATIHNGIARAVASRATTVDIGVGTYDDAITLPSGLTVQGGFTATWAPGSDGGAATVIQGQANPPVTAADLASPTTLSSVTVINQQTPAAGESLYGVFVTGVADAGAPLTLDNVIVTVASAGAGNSGTQALPAAPAAASCTASDGASEGNGGQGGTNPGTFGAGGYTTGDGSPGTDGTAGHAGKAGAQVCFNLGECHNGCSSALCGVLTVPIPCAAGGAPGCGGGGGGGGGGGQGGGSSIALYVWGAKVAANGGSFHSGNGGAGGVAAVGAPGAVGSPATAPPSQTCAPTVGNCGQTTCSATSATVSGTAGTAGGSGGAGGPGGGGAGGSSYAVFYEGAAPPVITGTTLTFGQAGSGGGGAPAGQSGQLGTSP